MFYLYNYIPTYIRNTYITNINYYIFSDHISSRPLKIFSRTSHVIIMTYDIVKCIYHIAIIINYT